MTNVVLVLLWCSLFVAASRAASWEQPKPPVFSDVYKLKYTITLPHLSLQQPRGLSYPVEVWYDGPNRLRRVDTSEGLNSVVTIGGVDYALYPRIDKLDCSVSGGTHAPVTSVLPDISGWHYTGRAELPGVGPADMWSHQRREEPEKDKVSQYVFYTQPGTGAPLQLSMIGHNMIADSHFDEYLYVFTHYEPSLPPNATNCIFRLHTKCMERAKQLQQQQQHQQHHQQQQHGQHGHDGQEQVHGEAGEAGAAAAHVAQGGGAEAKHPEVEKLEALLPHVRSYDHSHAYRMWSWAHGRKHAHAQDFQERLDVFKSRVHLVQSHNSREGSSYRLRVAPWADWHPDEMERLLRPNRGRIAKLLGDKYSRLSELPGPYAPLGRFSATLTKEQLPKSVDWRGTGADPGVKDQASCGSCYSFAATASMEGAWYLATGQRRSFSEQQVLDCSWDFGPQGCDGGDYQPVFNYVKKAGGIALEQDYPYRAQQDWCRSSNHTLVGRFSGYLSVDSRDEVALMEAVWRHGPVAVAVDPNDMFCFYSEGVMDTPTCSHKMRDLDHAVALFGYGTTKEGVDYWLVRNTWSKFYGQDGYIKIVRGSLDCGIATDPAVAVVPGELHVAGAAEAARAEAERW